MQLSCCFVSGSADKHQVRKMPPLFANHDLGHHSLGLSLLVSYRRNDQSILRHIATSATRKSHQIIGTGTALNPDRKMKSRNHCDRSQSFTTISPSHYDILAPAKHKHNLYDIDEQRKAAGFSKLSLYDAWPQSDILVGQIYMSLLEKAYAKMIGSYEAIVGGNMDTTIPDLFGGSIPILVQKAPSTLRATRADRSGCFAAELRKSRYQCTRSLEIPYEESQGHKCILC